MMPGLIGGEMPEDDAQGAVAGAGGESDMGSGGGMGGSGADKSGAQGGGKFKTKIIDSLPQNLKDPFERTVLAGMKFMYSDQAQEMIDKEFAGDKPMFQKLAESITGLMGLLGSQAKSMPPGVVVPAGIELLYEAADFIKETNRGNPSPDDVKRAAQYFVVLVMQSHGASKEQITQALSGAGMGGAAAGGDAGSMDAGAGMGAQMQGMTQG